MIRSAKMKAITPPKLMPPFQSTAASGTFPIEQTKLTIATSGPISGPQNFAERRVVVEEEPLPERVGHPGGERAGDEQAADDVAPDRRPVHHEVVGGRGEAPPASAAAARSSRSPWTHMSISAWPSIEPDAGPCRPARAPPRPGCWVRKRAEQQREEDDHQRAADELAERELPAEQQRHDDPELDDEVGRGELERHRRGEVGALAEERPRERDGGVGAATTRPRRGRWRSPASAASRRAAAGASRPSRRPPAPPPRARSPRISAHRISQNIPNANESASPTLVRTATSIAALYARASPVLLDGSILHS